MQFELRHFPTVDSTMTKASELAANGMPLPAIVLADEQSAGRGRIPGRVWEGRKGSSLLMTLALELPESSQTAITLKAGLALCLTLEGLLQAPKAGADSRGVRSLAIKWPNDVLARSQPAFGKIAGILCEARGSLVLLGIGLNLDGAAYPSSLSGTSTNLRDLTGSQFTTADARVGLALKLGAKLVQELEDSRWKEKYEERLWAKDERIEFSIGSPERGRFAAGIERGISEEGLLLLETKPGKLEAFHSGEVTRQIVVDAASG